MIEEYKYEDMAEALRMLEQDCEPLKFEVFLTFTELVDSGQLKEYKPQDIVLHAMMDWDLA